MPKIEVYEDALSAYIGRPFTLEELEEMLPAAKAELDEPGRRNPQDRAERYEPPRSLVHRRTGTAAAALAGRQSPVL